MTTEELDLYCGLLEDYYGSDYISDYKVLQELLRIEFDKDVEIEELRILTGYKYEEEDVRLTKEHCGINY